MKSKPMPHPNSIKNIEEAIEAEKAMKLNPNDHELRAKLVLFYHPSAGCYLSPNFEEHIRWFMRNAPSSFYCAPAVVFLDGDIESDLYLEISSCWDFVLAKSPFEAQTYYNAATFFTACYPRKEQVICHEKAVRIVNEGLKLFPENEDLNSLKSVIEGILARNENKKPFDSFDLS